MFVNLIYEDFMTCHSLKSFEEVEFVKTNFDFHDLLHIYMLEQLMYHLSPKLTQLNDTQLALTQVLDRFFYK